MFCYQCQESYKNEGCTKVGMCGKSPSTSDLEDLLLYVTKLSCKEAEKISDIEILKKLNEITTENLFITITNANFDDERINEAIDRTINFAKENLRASDFYDNMNRDARLQDAKKVGVLSTKDEDIRSLKELITYGLKGLCAYLKHANVLGFFDESIDTFVRETLANLLDDNLTVEELINLTLKTGEFGVKVMTLLDRANSESFGKREITEVSLEPRKNPGILISGHDLKDMKMLLEQTKNTGVDVYTHSEMLPANYYSEFKKYENLVGNYGGAWYNQRVDFSHFNGPILMTTNCIVPPHENASYKDKMFTTNAAGFPGMIHIKSDENGNKDFTEIIELAKKCKAPDKIESGKIVGGFAHEQVFELADKIVDAVKSGAIKKFVVMSGCDGRHKERDYYTEFAQKLPEDTVILTSGCAKYRYIKLGLSDIDGIPRVLDAGQCNDSYSWAVVALKLKEIFELNDINELPIFFNIAWYEQKAVIVLLALLSLGIKNIHLGPTLPAFLSENVAKVLVENFGIAKNQDVDSDIKNFVLN